MNESSVIRAVTLEAQGFSLVPFAVVLLDTLANFENKFLLFLLINEPMNQCHKIILFLN